MAREDPKAAKAGLVQEIKSHGVILGGFVALLWVIQIVNAIVFQGALASFGVQPRTLFGLLGILFAPFLHASFAHLVANTIPLVILGWFVMLRKKRDLLFVSLAAALVGGLGTWLIAPAATVHVGASVLIFGYLGYLLSRGIFEKRIGSILGSLVVFFLYGGALFGVLPGEVGVSWQGHLFGLIGGVLAARLLRRAPDATKGAPKSTAPAARIEAPKARVAPALRVGGEPEDESDTDEELAEMKRRLGR